MKVRILSDLHLDVNEAYPFELKDKDTFTILCGDVSGDPKITCDWIANNVKNGVFVAGNHLVYNQRGLSIEELRREMMDSDTGNVQYLDCTVEGCPCVKQLDENLLVVGSTMYTDFSLPVGLGMHSKEEEIYVNKSASHARMNDYRWGRTARGRMIPDDYIPWYNEFFAVLKKTVEENKDKDIIVATHYCPSPKCISPEYVDSDINASYVVPLDDFIVSHPNIKCWACGHVHHQDSFKIGNCVVVMNPRGYVAHLEDSDFDSRLWIDTKTWKLHKHKKTPKEAAEYERRCKDFMRCSAWFL